MNAASPGRDWTPVAPTWEHDQDDKDIWRRAARMPSLTLNRIELELLGSIGGSATCICGVGDGMAAACWPLTRPTAFSTC